MLIQSFLLFGLYSYFIPIKQKSSLRLISYILSSFIFFVKHLTHKNTLVKQQKMALLSRFFLETIAYLWCDFLAKSKELNYS